MAGMPNNMREEDSTEDLEGLKKLRAKKECRNIRLHRITTLLRLPNRKDYKEVNIYQIQTLFKTQDQAPLSIPAPPLRSANPLHSQPIPTPSQRHLLQSPCEQVNKQSMESLVRLKQLRRQFTSYLVSQFHHLG